MPLLATRNPALHKRGLERRSRLERAGRELLRQRDLDAISLGDVALHAGVPVSSAYHFYADIRDLYATLLVRFEQEHLAHYRRPLRGVMRGWPAVIAALVRRGARVFAADPAAAQLMVGPKTPADLKLRERANDIALGRLYEQHLDSHFELPPIPQRAKIFFRTVEIIDLMFCLSLLEDGHITGEYIDEAIRAAVAYLGSYLPAKLHKRPQPLHLYRLRVTAASSR